MICLRIKSRATILLSLLFLCVVSVSAQSGGHTLWGDIKVDESELTNGRVVTFMVILYQDGGGFRMRQTVPGNGRYRFFDVRNGHYEVAVEFENVEIARISVTVQSPFKTDFREDIELKWKGTPIAKTSVVSAAGLYDRTAANRDLFRRAREASDKKHYDKSISFLNQLVANDPKDFPAWEELATMHFILKEFSEAESAYSKSAQLKPDFEPALVNLGRVRIAVKNFSGAIEVLDRAVKNEPTSPEANYFLGEAYLQAQLGSKAVPYLNEAIRLNPVTMAEAHLRLAALYNAKGLKQKAANEYAAFLKQRPDYPERKKLEAFIASVKNP